MSTIPDYTSQPRDVPLEELPEKMPGPGSSQADYDRFWNGVKLALQRQFEQLRKELRDKTS